MTDVAPTPLDLDACAAEPIRIPGAIQPHGALLVVDPQRFTRRHASANLAEVTGLTVEDGQALGDLPDAASLAAELRRWQASGEATFLRTLHVGRFVYQVAGHQTDQGLILEFEDPPHSEAETLEGLYPRLRSFLDTIAKAADIPEIAQAAVREVRALTGFNRVMLYSFDTKGDGTVLAEDGDGVLPSYLGQRFPASDIPAQARELYRINRVRLIPDASYIPCAVEPASGVDGRALDLSHAALRSVSPVHLEYMRNMGTGASMSISLLIDGELWGLISGHSRDPHRVNAQVRTACDILGQILSLQIEARQQAGRSARLLELKQVETELVATLAPSVAFQHALVASSRHWLALTGAAGAAVVTRGAVQAVGLTPPHAAMLGIVEWLQARGEPVVALESLSEAVTPEAEAFAAEASGLLAVSISQLHPDYILWFRPEVVRTIDWSGDPAKPMIAGADRLHPRRSFELWREQVRLRSLPWSPEEVDSARSFRSAIQNLVLKRAEERAELTGQLERINKELESFSYSISHDLRAPFRHIVGYAELLSDRARDALDDKSRHYLQSVTESALSAGRLVDDLLNFSQLGRANLTATRVDMEKLVAEVRRTLHPDMAGRTIDWRVGPLPPAWGDSAMLRQVLQNLLENAVKYTGPRERAEIEVTGEEHSGEVAYTVRDNGVGFDMAYVGKLFGVFQRLHRVEDFEGTGIGLALAKRIIDRHGGTISAHGVLGQGASFTITLPKRAAEAPRGDELRG